MPIWPLQEKLCNFAKQMEEVLTIDIETNRDITDDKFTHYCIYYVSIIGITLWLLWILWMPFLQVLLLSPHVDYEIATTISHTFATYNTTATVYFVGPFSIIFLFRFFNTANSTLHHSTKLVVIIILIIIQYTTMLVIRNDTIKGDAHYIFTGVTFFLVYAYHVFVRDVHRDTKKQKAIVASFGIIFLCIFASTVIFSQHNAWYITGCVCEVIGVFLTACLDLIDVDAYGASLETTTRKPDATRAFLCNFQCIPFDDENNRM